MGQHVVDPEEPTALQVAPVGVHLLLRHAAERGVVRVTFVLEFRSRGASREPVELWKVFAVDDRGRYGVSNSALPSQDEALFEALADLGVFA